MSFGRKACSASSWAFFALACAAIQLFQSPASAGDYSIRSWGMDEGLSQSSLTDIAQTPDGYLWIGTLFGGLSRFDGVQFVNFDGGGTNGLGYPGIRCLLVGAAGDLWVNDYGNNLYCRRGNRFESMGLHDVALRSLVAEHKDRLVFSTLKGELVEGRRGANGVWCWDRYKPSQATGNFNYVEDSQGVLWFQVPGNKLGRFANGQFELMQATPGLERARIQTLARDDAGRIWVGTSDGLARWDGSTFTNANPPGTKAQLSVKSIIPVGPESFWVEGDGKLRLLADGQWKLEVAGWDSAQLSWPRGRDCRSDNAGGLWISLREEGLVHVRADGSLARITSADGLPSQLVQAFYLDREGTLWIGYHRGGLVQVRRRLFHPVARTEGLLDTVVTSISEDAEGRIWIGTAGGSVARWGDGSCTNFTLPLHGALCQDVVLHGAPDGRIWLGTAGNGLLVFEQGRFRHVIEPGQLNQRVRLLLVTRQGRVWFATLYGLYFLEGDKPVGALGIRSLGIRSYAQFPAALAESPDGAIWLGTFGGSLMRFAEGKWTTFTPEDGFPASSFYALLPEADGTIWIGTMNQGLLRFHNGRFARLTKSDGLPDNGVLHILSDGGPGFWLGTRAGVVRLDKSELEARATGGPKLADCRIFGRGDGLLTTALTLEFQPAVVRGRDGRLWFGTANGASWIRPGDARPRQPAPGVVIESATVDGNMTEVLARSSTSQSNADPMVAPLVIGPGVKDLELRFTAPNFTAPELVRYKYRLDGLDADWSAAGSRRAVTYAHLRPGKYTFRVTAENSDGVWNEDGASLQLEVRPYFWQRTSFIVAIIGLASGSLALGVRSVTRRRLQRKLDILERQRELERERARIAQDLHDDVGAGLTEISLTSDLVQSPMLGADESRQYICDIGARARELVQSMDEIVWAVNPRNDSVVTLAAYMCQYAQRLLKTADIRCRLDVQNDLPSATFNSEQRYQLFLAFKEAASNIARHSRASEARLAIKTAGHMLHITLEDNGCGFDPNTAAVGADGLRNMRERLVRLGGQCAIVSQPAGGAQVRFSVPLGTSALVL